MHVRAGRPAFARPYVGVHRSTDDYTNKQFYFKQFHIVYVYSLIVKPFLFQAIHFGPTALIQTI